MFSSLLCDLNVKLADVWIILGLFWLLLLS